MTKTTLDKKTFKQIEILSKEGNKLVDQGKYNAALWKYNEAIDLIEKPQNIHDAYTWLLSSVGDVYFLKQEFEKSASAFYDALNSSGGNTKGFIYLRLGQSLYEIEDLEKSKEMLFKAYILEGALIFNSVDRKYIRHIASDLENYLNISLQDHHNNKHIATPLPIQKKEALELFNDLEPKDSNFFSLAKNQKVLQFSGLDSSWMLDIPSPKDRGSFQKKVNKSEAKDFIAYFFDEQMIPDIPDLHFEKW